MFLKLSLKISHNLENSGFLFFKEHKTPNFYEKTAVKNEVKHGYPTQNNGIIQTSKITL